MKTMSPALKGDVITGIAVTVVGLVYYIATFWIQETKNIVTPRTFPAIVGVALILLGVFIVVQAVYRGKKTAEAGLGDGDTAPANVDGHGATASASVSSGVVLDAPEDPPSKKVVLQFALFFVYLAILIPVGFLLSTAAFLMMMTSIYARDRWIRNLIFSVLFAVIIYVAFVYGLAVYLPVGILG